MTKNSLANMFNFGATTVYSFDEAISQEEANEYYKRGLVGSSPDKPLATIDCSFDGDDVILTYTYISRPFERIRRITGYLSTLDKFNDAKAAEVADRTSNSISDCEECFV